MGYGMNTRKKTKVKQAQKKSTPDKEIALSDEVLYKILKARLQKDRIYYTDFLKKLIDAVSTKAIPPKIFFEILTPDFLFYPEVRKTIKEWLQVSRNGRLDPTQKEKAKEARDYLRQIGETLAAVGQGRPKSVSGDIELEIRYYLPEFNRIAQVYLEEALRFPDKIKKLLITEGFIKESEKLPSPEKLRNSMLAKKYQISIRQVEAILRKQREEIKWLRKELGYKPVKSDETDTEEQVDECTEADYLRYKALLELEGDDFDSKWKEIFLQ